MDKFMANQETQLLDNIIATSRRKMLTLGAASFASFFMAAGARSAEAATATYSDNDILNFALNLEYLESNFYYLAAFGTTIDKPNAASVAAGGPSAGIPITGSVGTAGTVSGGSMVPFTTDTTGITIGSYATETAIEEGKHGAWEPGCCATGDQLGYLLPNLGRCSKYGDACWKYSSHL
jgi:hypothetical protein